MYCSSCNIYSWSTRCPACWRGSGSGVPERDPKPRPLVETEPLDSVLVEQRGRLVITIYRTGGRSVHLLPPCARVQAE